MRNILKIEEIAMFFFSIFMFQQLNYDWWWFAILILTPDLSMLGYLINERIGAYAYNVGHHKGIALFVFAVGTYLNNSPIELTGIILFGHSSMDRIFGYGLKYTTGFKNTHLGIIGNSN